MKRTLIFRRDLNDRRNFIGEENEGDRVSHVEMSNGAGPDLLPDAHTSGVKEINKNVVRSFEFLT